MIASARPSDVQAIIEIDGSGALEIPATLIQDAYSASRHGLIGLCLRGTSPEMVDRILDPVVATLGTKVYGVRYFSADEESTVATVASTVRFAVASSQAFRALVLRLGIPTLGPGELSRCVADYLSPGATHSDDAA